MYNTDMIDRFLTPQQELFLEYYTDPKSETFGNCTQSGLRAGYSQEYSENLTYVMPLWLSESIESMQVLKKAERNLNQVLDLDIVTDEGKIDTNILGHRTKVDMFIAERLGKEKYSTRNELTGKGGKDLVPEQLSEEQKEKLKSLLL
jgi:hypothetical protein